MNLNAKTKENRSRWPIFLLHSARGTLLLAISCALTSCGKPATAEECRRIVERITELELQEASIQDAAEVKAQVAATQGAFKERTLRDCVGQRVPAGALRCVEKATKARQIVEECFD